MAKLATQTADTHMASPVSNLRFHKVDRGSTLLILYMSDWEFHLEKKIKRKAFYDGSLRKDIVCLMI